MTEGPFRVETYANGDRSDIVGPSGVLFSCISTPEAKSHARCFNTAVRAALPALTKQRDDLARLAQSLIDTLNAHEVDSLDCDRSGVTHCDCLTKAIDRLAAAIKESKP